MTYFSLDALPVSRWRNGGGETREIVAIPAAQGGFSWRASIATIAQDGDFSAFPGIDRVITLLSGDGVELTAPGWQQRLLPGEPFAFRGEDAVSARLCGGVSQDFNLMTDRESLQATMLTTDSAVTPDAHAAGIAYVLAGSWLSGDRPLTVNQGVWWQADGPSLQPNSPQAKLLFATLLPR